MKRQLEKQRSIFFFLSILEQRRNIKNYYSQDYLEQLARMN
jgi:hypothetical protein